MRYLTQEQFDGWQQAVHNWQENMGVRYRTFKGIRGIPPPCPRPPPPPRNWYK